ncbi:NAD-dependent epimerase/dehydratase family protein [Herbaspirillum rubrisubalbicans]|jgi:UDP-glucose 4-epimerase|uniref:Nucleoside-diphosphate sugar epimerase n=1 Tax=Herbaspirillum rubrisubalbicans TaxID=80842 RepID=A0AAD0XFR9_9BURK|nr:NAD-dependent epimerase/dehydratase family protein [Herbaspirillum rubrisubalbicans]AYR22733.1 nucleoside-diphosphate sugar epimerase [Herbaspirillum rubrisubalbicans]
MRTCVIGGAGFIGRHLVAQLLQTGRDVLVLGRRSERPSGLAKRAVYAACDYADREALRLHLGTCTEVVDLAYATVPQTSFVNPVFDLQANLPASVGLLQESAKLGHLRQLMIVSSGGTVYGPVPSWPICEDEHTSPISPYGITKLTLEHYGRMFHRLHGLPVTIVRPANAYGAGQKPFVGQGFIATAIGHILKREQVTIFGEHGTIRDYLHVSDVAAGMVAALEGDGQGETYNIGSGVGMNNREVLSAIEPHATTAGYSIKLQVAPERHFDVPVNVLNSNKLKSHSGWQPKVDFSEGIKEVWTDIAEMISS